MLDGRRRRARVSSGPRSEVVLAVFGVTLFFVLVASAWSGQQRQNGDDKQQIYEFVHEIPASDILKLDAILVLGGGAPESLENPPKYTKERCDLAAQVVKKRRELEKVKTSSSRIKLDSKSMKSNDLPVLCLSAGTAHVPQLLAKDGLPVWESTSSAAYLQRMHGLSNLYVETTSYDTIGNAFYTRTSHTDINGWRRLLIITSEFHMERTKAIFDWIFLAVEPNLGYNLLYLVSKNTGLDKDALQARSDKEKQSLESVHSYASRFGTLQDVYRFMTRDHALYTANKLVERAKTDPKSHGSSNSMIVKSYGGGTT